MIHVLRRVREFLASPLGKPLSELQESLASNWVAIKLSVISGQIEPDAPIYIGEFQPGRNCGYMTVQAVLKTVEDGWGHWDRKTIAWWCQVLEQASVDLIADA
ncbi:MAG: hypothetical protein MUP14_00145 [Dehalococcoidia bacterium]|nr:hypothetical protein [Dehalococcoidia bacterium]